MSHEDTYLTTADAAAILHEQPQTWRKRRWKGGGPPFVRIGNRCLYPRASTLAWIAEHIVTNTSRPNTQGATSHSPQLTPDAAQAETR